ncbi:hypothetical protein D9Q98_001064 [Chlorella vulgaris]|uniref:Core domain-containing protein n=1 Tax=Chlorella vulgaris TaxID=3077 RepID=A0A9D4TZI4_CHLVU|nr:hypothetical protein D9Q98_001064 [Chlorella vulgaris]
MLSMRLCSQPRPVAAHVAPTCSLVQRPATAATPAPAPFRQARRLPAVRPAAAATEGKSVVAPPVQPITLTDAALAHLKKLRAESGDAQLLLRMGVKSGGCSGMSYVMDFEKPENVKKDDVVMEYKDGDFKLVCDPKSLLYLFGLRLDYSSALIAGGFQFSNPNSTSDCGCGKSFGV